MSEGMQVAATTKEVFDFDDLDAYLETHESAEEVPCEHCNATEALFKCLDSRGCIDMKYMTQVSGLSFEELVEGLGRVIYQDPRLWGEDEQKGWVLGSEYLSGNLLVKLDEVIKANEIYSNRFESNEKALRKLLRPEIDPSNIHVTLGATWVPSEVYDAFLLHLVGRESNGGKASKAFEKFSGAEYAIRFEKSIEAWYIPFKGRFSQFHVLKPIIYEYYGTQYKGMLNLLEDTMNMKTPQVTHIEMVAGKAKPVVDKSETLKLVERQRRLAEEFGKWLWADEDRKNLVLNAYMRKFGNIRCKVYDGSFLTFPGLNPAISLYPYQRNAVARILFSRNTLLAHSVGTGKTYEIVAACMQLRRMDMSRKNMVVVPNNILGQWQSDWLALYPQAHLFVIDSKVYNKKTAATIMQRMRDEDYDAILVTASCFDSMFLGKNYLINKYENELERLQRADAFVRQHVRKHKSMVHSVEKELLQLQENNALPEEGFEGIGIQTLFVDEAHNYKNLKISTSSDDISGFSTTGSEKCKWLYEKIQHIQEQKNGRIVFATGTPVTNSIADLYVMQKYLQGDELNLLGLSGFDAWAAMFIEKSTEVEIDVSTTCFKVKTRFASFKNLPELADILSEVADFHEKENTENLPVFVGYSDILCNGGRDFRNYLEDIGDRVFLIRNRHSLHNRNEDNLLKVTTDGRKAALDMRLVGDYEAVFPKSKVELCASQVMRVWQETGGTQLVFCDISTPKQGFNIYDELRNVLVGRGMPEEKICFIHDAKTASEKKKLFSKMNNGEVAVLIGSTAKLGVGVNVQKKLIAVHHLDLPWRPSDIIQREGRIIRPGNQNDKVFIFRYITQSSFDAYSWQILEHKQKFISQLLSGCVSERSASDIDSAVLTYAELKALSIGDPKMKQRCELSNELDRLKLLQRGYIEDLHAKRVEKQTLPVRLADYQTRAEKVQKDIIALEGLDRMGCSLDAAAKKTFNHQIFSGVRQYQSMPEDIKVGTFAGFDIVVPAHMVPRVVGKNENGGKTATVSYVVLRGNANYIVDIESESGVYTRLSNFCFDRAVKKAEKESGREVTEIYRSGIRQSFDKLQESIKSAAERLEVLEQESLEPTNEYPERINELSRKLNELDLEMKAEAERESA